jgi:hypothetical protein
LPKDCARVRAGAAFVHLEKTISTGFLSGE